MAVDFTDLPAIESFLSTRLREPLPGADAHRRFAPRPAHAGWRPDDLPSHARRAAALILLYPTERGVALPLTMRHRTLPHHAGQISLPGGRIDLDESAEEAALREAEEEIGVNRRDIRILGPLSTLWVIVSNHVVQPFVAAASSRPEFRLSSREVEKLIEMPLADLHDAARLAWDRRVRDGVLVDVPFFRLEEQQIWGATAMMLGEFAALFQEGFAPPDLR